MRSKPYNSNFQIYAMRSAYPQFKYKMRGKYDIEFIGDLHVLPEFPVYTVSITYQGNARPAVKIISPQLVEKPPHIFPDTRNLCLYHADHYKWRKEKYIASDIVPWTAAWIYFYEVWLQTGKWYGPEVPHTTVKQEKQ